MQVKLQGNQSYAATVVQVNELRLLPGLDRLRGLDAFGYQALVPAETEIGSVLVVFVAGSVLSHEFVAGNNLYRHGRNNVDQSRNGYIEDNRRVKAIKLRGARSDALAMPLESLAAVLGYVPELKPGVQFDTIDDHQFCEKFVQKRGECAMKSRTAVSKKLVSDQIFPEHYETQQYARNVDKYQPDDHVIVTQKLHGTSVRFGVVPVSRRLSTLERLFQFLGFKVAHVEPSFVVGSRRVTKSVNGESNPTNHWYADDLWTKACLPWKDMLPAGFIVYAEIIGWAGDAPIQKGYTYHLSLGHHDVYVYRVTTINEDGDQFELPWHEVERFCLDAGLKTVPVLFSGSQAEFESRRSEFIDRALFPEFREAVPVAGAENDDPDLVDEGVCIRSQNNVVTKFKSPIFLGHESKLMDANVADIEEDESTEEEPEAAE